MRIFKFISLKSGVTCSAPDSHDEETKVHWSLGTTARWADTWTSFWSWPWTRCGQALAVQAVSRPGYGPRDYPVGAALLRRSWGMAAFRENARLIVRRLGRVGDARASATIRNSESTHRRLRRVYENAAEHYRCVSTSGKHGRRH